MSYEFPRVLPFRRSISVFKTKATLVSLLLLLFAANVSAQSFAREIDTSEKVSLAITSRNGRVTVIASDQVQKRVSIAATSTGAAVDPTDVPVVVKGESVDIEVRARGEKDRIDLIVRIPPRSKVKVDSEAGAVDVVGNLESADVKTNTGTIHADVPLDAVKFNFLWGASRPRFLSDVELPKIKEKSAGVFAISGNLGEKKAKAEKPRGSWSGCERHRAAVNEIECRCHRS